MAPSDKRRAQPRTAPTDAPITVLLLVGQLSFAGDVFCDVGREEVEDITYSIIVPGAIEDVSPLLQQSNTSLVQHH